MLAVAETLKVALPLSAVWFVGCCVIFIVGAVGLPAIIIFFAENMGLCMRPWWKNWAWVSRGTPWGSFGAWPEILCSDTANWTEMLPRLVPKAGCYRKVQSQSQIAKLLNDPIVVVADTPPTVEVTRHRY